MPTKRSVLVWRGLVLALAGLLAPRDALGCSWATGSVAEVHGVEVGYPSRGPIPTWALTVSPDDEELELDLVAVDHAGQRSRPVRLALPTPALFRLGAAQERW